MSRTVQITLRANRTLGTASDSDAVLTLTPLGLVISEHIDKISFFEPAIAVCDKTITPDAVTFVLRCDEALAKSLEEVVRGFRIGCFHIAREYKLVSTDDPAPIFAEGFEVQELAP